MFLTFQLFACRNIQVQCEDKEPESSSMTYVPYGCVDGKWSNVSLRRKTHTYISNAHVHKYTILDKILKLSNKDTCVYDTAM